MLCFGQRISARVYTKSNEIMYLSASGHIPGFIVWEKQVLQYWSTPTELFLLFLHHPPIPQAPLGVIYRKLLRSENSNRNIPFSILTYKSNSMLLTSNLKHEGSSEGGVCLHID